MTIITKSMITMSQRVRLHDRICPPRNVGTGSLLRSPRFARTKWFLPADLAGTRSGRNRIEPWISPRLHGACPPRGRRPGRSLAGAVIRVRDGGDRLVVGAGNPPSNAPFDDPVLTIGGHSVGKITRHRLNPFGDRQLNRALHVIINWRILHHDGTRAYLTRRAGQKTEREIRRCLKRYAARSLYRLMETAART